MNNIFFDTGYSSFAQTLIKIIVFLFASGIVVYIIYLLFAKILFRKSKYRKEIRLRLIFLWSLLAYLFLFNLYLFFLFYKNGIDSFQWTKATFYLGILAQIIVYIGVIAYFFIGRTTLKKIIKEKTIS